MQIFSHLEHYFEIQPTKEFITALIEEENKGRLSDKSTVSDIYNKQIGIKSRKFTYPKIGVCKKRGISGGDMDPPAFIY